MRVETGSPFEAEYAYCRAVVKGNWCFVSGTTGYDYARMEVPENAYDQALNALRTIQHSLEKAGFEIGDIVRAHYIITDGKYRSEIAPALREVFGTCRPAATMIIAGLIEPEMKVEIEVTAFRGE